MVRLAHFCSTEDPWRFPSSLRGRGEGHPTSCARCFPGGKRSDDVGCWSQGGTGVDAERPAEMSRLSRYPEGTTAIGANVDNEHCLRLRTWVRRRICRIHSASSTTCPHSGASPTQARRSLLAWLTAAGPARPPPPQAHSPPPRPPKDSPVPVPASERGGVHEHEGVHFGDEAPGQLRDPTQETSSLR